MSRADIQQAAIRQVAAIGDGGEVAPAKHVQCAGRSNAAEGLIQRHLGIVCGIERFNDGIGAAQGNLRGIGGDGDIVGQLQRCACVSNVTSQTQRGADNVGKTTRKAECAAGDGDGAGTGLGDGGFDG